MTENSPWTESRVRKIVSMPMMMTAKKVNVSVVACCASIVSMFVFLIASVPTKRSLRLKTWRKIENKRCAPNPYSIYNRVPNFNGADQAATLLSETDEYKNASEYNPVVHVTVCIKAKLTL